MKTFFTVISDKRFQNFIFLIALFVITYSIHVSQQSNNWMSQQQTMSVITPIALGTFLLYRFLKLILPNYKILSKVVVILLWSSAMFLLYA
jgi:hypothetical protein